MSDDNPIERDLGRPLRRPEIERQLGRPLRPSLPPPDDALDDEPLVGASQTRIRTPARWPDEEAATPAMDLAIIEGDIAEAIDWYFPLVWAACVIIISYIGIYHAVDKITAHNPLPPSLSF